MFNYGVDSDSSAVCLSILCKKQPAAWEPWRFAAGGVVEGVSPISGFCGSTLPPPGKTGAALREWYSAI
uniref:Uncharacterized protein n=1 Tax=Myoviridae sp. ctuIn11 TaxID=2827715 RepID=A0A8S5SIX0_9CAUD|nr:MAG TPA: hypothetical protein [Myoviridae sp. ctuIn11]